MIMKKMLFLTALLFSVVCYAAPPPEKVSCPIADDVGYVVQDIQSVEVIAEFDFAAIKVNVPEIGLIVQEVAFVDIGNTSKNLFLSNKINNYNYLQNKQYDNYGYPLTGDRCRVCSTYKTI
jgi:hypothetical protein